MARPGGPARAPGAIRHEERRDAQANPSAPDRSRARRQADRERIEQDGGALLTADGWQRWIRVPATNGQLRCSLRNQGRTPTAAMAAPARMAGASQSRLPARAASASGVVDAASWSGPSARWALSATAA
jgi:hypothetical protein